MPPVMHRMNQRSAARRGAEALTVGRQIRSNLAAEYTEQIGEGSFGLDVERGNWAPASEPADEIGSGTGQYGTGAGAFPIKVPSRVRD
jgi:hypothetical protein